MTRFSKDDRVRAVSIFGTVLSRQGIQVHVKWDNGDDSWENAANLSFVYDEPKPDPIRVGDSVTRKGHDVVGKVEALDHGGFPTLADVRWSADGRSFVPVDQLVKVEEPKPLSWKDLEADDKVTLKVIANDETLTATVVRSMYGPVLLGWDVGAKRVSPWLTKCTVLLSVEKPAPPLPTQPGSVIYLPRPDQFAHRTNDHDRLPWIADDGARLTDRQVAEQGWEVA